jgi:4-hydroxyphenylpyruvate dioxygenase
VSLLWSALLVVSDDSVSALSTSTAAGTWKPKANSPEEHRNLKGLKRESETIGSLGFHHIEFFCGDAKSTANQFALALGMRVTGVTGQSTGNDQCISYGLESGDFRLLLTAPYSRAVASQGATGESSNDKEYDAVKPLPQFSPNQAHAFFQKHGLAARAVCLQVKDAQKAFFDSVEKGAQPVLEPTFVATCPGQANKGVSSKGCYMSEVELYGDVVLRYISFPEEKTASTSQGGIPFLPHLAPMEGKLSEKETFGIQRVDHAVGNVPNLLEAVTRISKFTGFHEFAEFTTADVGTIESGLNSVVLASDTEAVLLPLNEPTAGK